MARPIWFVNFLKKIYPQRRIFAKMTRLPLIGALVDFIFFRGDEMVYLPMDKTIQINQQLETEDSVILPSQVVEYFINQASHHWIMDSCICRQGDDCQHYPHDLGCIFLGEPVTQINSHLGRLVSREEALEHARKCREAGLVHTIGRNRLDAIWLGAGPSDRLMTICNCCPCCCLWGLVTDLDPVIAGKIVKMPGVEIQVTDNCSGCGLCVNGQCSADAIHLDNGKAVINLECRVCGRCAEICPEQAIRITLHGNPHLQETIERLQGIVDPS